MSNKNTYRNHIFPILKDKNKIDKLLIDDESINFISNYKDASIISSIIITYLDIINKPIEDIIITDATAGVGGNTISFCINFGYCIGIEIDEIRRSYLKNNLDIYELKNYKTLCGDCTKVLRTITIQDIVFIDPPWGGKDYKKYNNLKLSLSNKSIESIVNELFESKDYICNPKMVVLKLPLNYDLSYLLDNLSKFGINIHKLNKMYIFIITKEYHHHKIQYKKKQ